MPSITVCLQQSSARERCEERSRLTRPHTESQLVGLSIGRVPYVETNSRDIMLEHLKNGLDQQVSCWGYVCWSTLRYVWRCVWRDSFMSKSMLTLTSKVDAIPPASWCHNVYVWYHNMLYMISQCVELSMIPQSVMYDATMCYMIGYDGMTLTLQMW